MPCENVFSPSIFFFRFVVFFLMYSEFAQPSSQYIIIDAARETLGTRRERSFCVLLAGRVQPHPAISPRLVSLKTRFFLSLLPIH